MTKKYYSRCNPRKIFTCAICEQRIIMYNFADRQGYTRVEDYSRCQQTCSFFKSTVKP